MKWIVKNKFELMSAINALVDVDINSMHTLTLKKVRGKRSLSQNSLMWVWCTFVSRETGQDKSDIYYDMAKRYSPYKDYTDCEGNMTFRQMALSELNPKQYNEVLMKTREFWQEFANITLVWPDDYRFNLFYEEAT